MNDIVEKGINMYKEPSRIFMVLSVLAISLMLSLIWLFVYFTGGTKYVYLHLNYIPITFSAFFFRKKGGISVAIIAGLLMGPLMPLDVENHINQSFFNYLYRTIIFILVGGFVGHMSKFLKSHLKVVQETLVQISNTYANTLKNYALMVSTRDEQTAFHCERVAYNSVLLGQAMELEEQIIDALYWGGLLHDVGKIGIKEKILLNPGKLTEEEFEEITRHTVIGYDLITSLSQDLDKVAEGVRSHHEKWNGSGYPDQLKGKDIPLYGRVIAVVDVFEALTSERPYKNAWKPDDAMKYILDSKGIQFDPYIVDYFEKLYREEKIWISNHSIELNRHTIKPLQFHKVLINS